MLRVFLDGNGKNKTRQDKLSIPYERFTRFTLLADHFRLQRKIRGSFLDKLEDIAER